MAVADRERWDAKYAQKLVLSTVLPDEWLTRRVEAMPAAKALELACGLGQNSIWLAGRGWSVDAVDISPVGLDLAREIAERAGTPSINWIAADLDAFEPDAEGYDLIVVFRFLDRQRLPSMIESSLRSGGALVYETFSQGQMARSDNHLKTAAFTLAPGELPTLFPNLTVVAAEEAELADRSVSRLFARKP